MLNSRLLSIIRKEFIQILRDPRTLVLVAVIPVMQLLLMGYAATTDVRNVPLAVFDLDRGPAARSLLEAYRVADHFAIVFETDSDRKNCAGSIRPYDVGNHAQYGNLAGQLIYGLYFLKHRGASRYPEDTVLLLRIGLPHFFRSLRQLLLQLLPGPALLFHNDMEDADPLLLGQGSHGFYLGCHGRRSLSGTGQKKFRSGYYHAASG